MTVQVNTELLGTLKTFGAFDVSACFNCGNCSAACPVSADEVTFPRRIIRYGQIGDREHLLGSKELWLCYYCGECSETCPRQAEPGEFMASARRYAIASLDPTGISRLLYTSNLFTAFFMAGLTALLAVILLATRGAMVLERPALFGFISAQAIHYVGMAAIFLALIMMVISVVRLTRLFRRSSSTPDHQEETGGATVARRLAAAIGKVVADLATEKYHRSCTEEAQPWYRSRWFMHWTIMWGFIGLAAATTFDYLLLLVADKVPGQPVPLWHPIRLLGTVTGMLVLFGTLRALSARIRKPEKYSSHSLLSDWLFLALLLMATITGFAVEFAVYLPRGHAWSYVAFLVHVIVAIEVVLLFPFTKFAHAVYRPMALLMREMTRRKSLANS